MPAFSPSPTPQHLTQFHQESQGFRSRLGSFETCIWRVARVKRSSRMPRGHWRYARNSWNRTATMTYAEGVTLQSPGSRRGEAAKRTLGNGPPSRHIPQRGFTIDRKDVWRWTRTWNGTASPPLC